MIGDYRSGRDQEERANLALGALDCLQDLLAGQYVGGRVSAEPLANLLIVINEAVRDAMPNGHPRHGRAVNDQDTG